MTACNIYRKDRGGRCKGFADVRIEQDIYVGGEFHSRIAFGVCWECSQKFHSSFIAERQFRTPHPYMMNVYHPGASKDAVERSISNSPLSNDK